MNICLVSANDVMEHFAFPGNIDFATDDRDDRKAHFHVLFLPSPRTASFQALSDNAFRWRIRDERLGDA